ncbi:MAG: zinc ABC transporter substrate-binding protein [Ruminococcaceae bacterium]|nr:zinc ABC transporter substrate-binding protein [Oscillospiraceae bacterium]
MRKISVLFLIFSMLFCVGCSGKDKDDGALDIVCTIFPQYDFARSIAGDAENVNIKVLIGPGQESHDYDPSSKDIAAVHDCDIFICTGGESDSWVFDMLESVDTSDKIVLSLMDVVKEPLKEDIESVAETEEHLHDHGAIDHVDYDEHVWTSPVNAMTIADSVCEAMCEKMPEASELFRENYGILKSELEMLDKGFRDLTANTAAPIIVVADRFPLLYFCEEYGIRYYAAFSGCAASTEPSSKTVQFLIEKVREENIPAVFKMDMSTGNVAMTVAEATGAKVLTFYSCHTVSTDDFNDGITYVDLMNRNLQSLKTLFVNEK